MLEKFLKSEYAKEVYQSLTDYTIWWRNSKYSAWVETRDLTDNDTSTVYFVKDYDLEDLDTPFCLWTGNGLFSFGNKKVFAQFTWFTIKDERDFKFLDKFIIYFYYKKRMYDEKHNKEVLVIRKLKGQYVGDGVTWRRTYISSVDLDILLYRHIRIFKKYAKIFPKAK